MTRGWKCTMRVWRILRSSFFFGGDGCPYSRASKGGQERGMWRGVGGMKEFEERRMGKTTNEKELAKYEFIRKFIGMRMWDDWVCILFVGIGIFQI